MIVVAGTVLGSALARRMASPWWAPDLVLVGLVLAVAYPAGFAAREAEASGSAHEARWRGVVGGALAGSAMAWLSVRDAAAIGAAYFGVGWLIGWIASVWDLADRRVCRIAVALGEVVIVTVSVALAGRLSAGLLLGAGLRVAMTTLALPVLRWLVGLLARDRIVASP